MLNQRKILTILRSKKNQQLPPQITVHFWKNVPMILSIKAFYYSFM